MSTRCNIIVDDGSKRIQIYRHQDGYPEGVLPDLFKALEYAWDLPRFEADDFAAAIVRAWKERGGDIYIDGSPKAWEMIHGDVEYVYIIKPPQKSKTPKVEVYPWHEYWLEKGDPNETKPKPSHISEIGGDLLKQ